MEGDSKKDGQVTKTNDDKTIQDSNDAKPFAGVPEMEFLDDVDKYMEQPFINGNAEMVLRRLEEQHSKYKFMEFNLSSKRKCLKMQIPDLEKSVEMINLLMKKKDQSDNFELSFRLAEQCFMKASVPPTDKVGLWLGANVMLEYPLEEAETLIMKNISTARKNLERIENDLNFLRDQFTTTEVNMARVFNWNVKKRMASRAEQNAERRAEQTA